MKNAKTNVALVDDHTLLRNGLASLINSFGDYQVLFEADNGKQLIQQLNPSDLPQIILLDINMPEMDGYETSYWLKEQYPDIKIIALSMYDNENSIIRMLKNGVRGYILKDIDPMELRTALDSVFHKGFYHSEMVTGKLIHSLHQQGEKNDRNPGLVFLSERETEFLRLACSEKTYKEIADMMYLSPRTIDGYRDGLFEKLQVKSRVGLVMYAIKNGIINF